MTVTISKSAKVQLNRGGNVSVTPGRIFVPTTTTSTTTTTTTATGVTYYVSTAGSDTNNGTSISTPWKTIAGVNSKMNQFQPGDQILFNRGDTFTTTTGLNITRNGISGSNIKFGAYGTGANPIFTWNQTNKILAAVNIAGKSYITIENLNFTDPLQPNTFVTASVLYGIAIDNATNRPNGTPSTNITIQDCSGSYIGTLVNLIADNSTVQRCFVTNIRMIRNTSGGTDDYGGVPVLVAGSNNLITNNLFTECWASSYDFSYDGGAVEFYDEYGTGVNNNIVSYNTFYHCRGFGEMGGNGSRSTPKTLDNNQYIYNKIINSGGIVFHGTGSGTFAASITNTKIYNNVILQEKDNFPLDPTSIMFWSDGTFLSNALDIKNNIFYLRNSSGSITILNGSQQLRNFTSHSYNIFNTGSGISLGFTKDATELVSNTQMWTNVSDPNSYNWNYNLLPGAAAINFGTNVGITKDFAGNTVINPPDAGILEYI